MSMYEPVFLAGEPVPAGKLQALGEWGLWTPALTVISGTDPTLGVGAITDGEWINNGGLITAQFRINFGTSGVAAGSGIYTIDTPVPINASWLTTGSIAIGQAIVRDATGPVIRSRTVRINGASSVVMSADAGANVTDAVPWTWAANDTLNGTFTYRAAA